MTKSWKRQRREAYRQFPDDAVREAVYSQAKSLQAQGIKIPQTMQDYIDHVDRVKRDIKRPETRP